MAKVDISQAHPIFQVLLERILTDLRNLGWQPKIASLKRTPAEQAEKVRQGVSKTMKSWHVESTMATIPHGPNMVAEIYGNAADIIDVRYGWSGLAAKRISSSGKTLGGWLRSTVVFGVGIGE
jgi:hypothetical protein